MFKAIGNRVIQPDQLLNLRFGKGFPSVRSLIPEKVILTYFSHSISFYSRKYQLVQRINWMSDFVQLGIFQVEGVAVGVVTLPYGAPVSSMVIEELASCGALFFLSVGFAGGISDELSPYDIIIPMDAIADEGVARFYQPECLAVPGSKKLIHILSNELANKEIRYFMGKTWSIASPYCETMEKVANLKGAGVLCVDMELASQYAVANYYGVEMASFFIISDMIQDNNWVPFFKEKKLHQVLNETLLLGIEIMATKVK